MDEDILNAVESLLGKDIKIIDCETSSSVQQEEVLLINGVPVKLDGFSSDDACAIKSALLDGQMPAVEHLNQLLFRAGLAQEPIEVETSLTVKSSLTTTEDVVVSRNGQVLDERSIETKEHFNHQSHQKELWQPIKHHQSVKARATPGNALAYRTNSNSTCATDTDNQASDYLGRRLNETFSNASIMSTSSALTSSDRVLDSASNISAATTIGDKQSNISSCDSGHDGLFHSASAAWSRGGRDTQTDSMYCDIPSSADEADAISASILNTTLQIIEQCADETLPTYAKNLPTAGTIDALVTTLAKVESEEIEFDLLLGAHLYMQPHELMEKLIPKCKSSEDLLRILKHWLLLCINDFRDESLLQMLRDIKDSRPTLSTFIDGIPGALEQRDNNRRVLQQHLVTKQSSGSSLARQSSLKSLKRFAANVYKTDNLLNNCSSAFELAHQLYAIEYAYMSQIPLEEFIEKFSDSELQENNTNYDASTLKKQPSLNHIAAYLRWSKRLTNLAATEIVKLSKKSQRVQMIDFWIETALECFNTGNFNSLMAILTALNMASITRLKKTWSKVQMTKFVGLEHQMDPSSDFVNYRSTMKAAVWRSERHDANEIERAIIPFLSLFLQDIYAISDSHQIKLPSGHVNFKMCTQLGVQLRDFHNWQQLVCPYEQIPKIITYLQNSEVFTDDAIWKASYDCEPPNSVEEKENYKTLKAAKKSST